MGWFPLHTFLHLKILNAYNDINLLSNTYIISFTCFFSEVILNHIAEIFQAVPICTVTASSPMSINHMLNDSTASGRSNLTNSQRLVHTVSNYRRLQKRVDADSTPVRTVVRPPGSPADHSPSSGAMPRHGLSHDDASVVFVRAKEYDERMKVCRHQCFLAQLPLALTIMKLSVH